MNAREKIEEILGNSAQVQVIETYAGNALGLEVLIQCLEKPARFLELWAGEDGMVPSDFVLEGEPPAVLLLVGVERASPSNHEAICNLIQTVPKVTKVLIQVSPNLGMGWLCLGGILVHEIDFN